MIKLITVCMICHILQEDDPDFQPSLFRYSYILDLQYHNRYYTCRLSDASGKMEFTLMSEGYIDKNSLDPMDGEL